MERWNSVFGILFTTFFAILLYPEIHQDSKLVFICCALAIIITFIHLFCNHIDRSVCVNVVSELILSEINEHEISFDIQQIQEQYPKVDWYQELKIQKVTQSLDSRFLNETVFPALFDQDCSICLQSFKYPVVTLCGHVFCQECILPVFSNQISLFPLCPLCRYNLISEAFLVPFLSIVKEILMVDQKKSDIGITRYPGNKCDLIVYGSKQSLIQLSEKIKQLSQFKIKNIDCH